MLNNVRRVGRQLLPLHPRLCSKKGVRGLQASFVLVLSADYQMTKLIPHWGLLLSLEFHTTTTYYFARSFWNSGSLKYVAVFDEQVGPKNSDHLLHNLHHSGLVPTSVRCVCIFLNTTTSTEQELLRTRLVKGTCAHHVMDLVQISFLITGHIKFAADRVFASIGSLYNHCDVFNWMSW